MWDYRTAAPDRYELLKAFAKRNRENMTLAERFLWQNLRSRRGEIKFLRQHIIGDYIVDFVSREGGIVIEVDGAYHAERQQEEKDEVRTRFLESQGFHVLRFTNEEVLYEIDEVLETINKNIKL